jgi:hypothetical protein
MRDGLEDYDYLWLLRECARKREGDGKADPALMKRAREISDDPKLHERLSCAKDLEALRTEIGTLIEKLKAAGTR